MSDDYFFGSISPSPRAIDIAKRVFAGTDHETNKALIEQIVEGIKTIEDDNQLAGRLLIHEIVRTVPDVEMYLLLNRNLLDKEIHEYMSSNASVFNEWNREYMWCNYKINGYFAASQLYNMYLFRSIAGKPPTETPFFCKLRIAVQFYRLVGMDEMKRALHEMCHDYYTHASPTIFNAGTRRPQMASCFQTMMKDDLSHMLKNGLADMGLISRHSGGIGFNASELRHSAIGETGTSSGVMPYARACDKVISYVDQGGKRNGAATMYLNDWHIDVEDFARSASNLTPQDLRLTGVTPAIWAHDLFFERLWKGESWTLFCPKTVPGLTEVHGVEFERLYTHYEKMAEYREIEYKNANTDYDEARGLLARGDISQEDYAIAHRRLVDATKQRIVYRTIKAQDLMMIYVVTQIRSGKPYVLNGDRSNTKSNHQNIGHINCSNLCTEILQYCSPDVYPICILGSLNLPKFVTGRYTGPLEGVDESVILKGLSKVYDFRSLGTVVRGLTRNLDQLVTYNWYPVEEKTRHFSENARSIGIGVSGLDDAFKSLDLIYGDPVSRALNKMIFACMYYHAVDESRLLSLEKGEYTYYRTGEFKTLDGKTLKGSPLSNGLFQFDLWKAEYEHDLAQGRVNPKRFDSTCLEPVDPRHFGVDGSWEALREAVVRDGVRNSLLIALMPTASTAAILGNAETVEAHQSNIYCRQLKNNSYTIVNRYLRKDVEEIGLDYGEVIDFLYENDGRMFPTKDLENSRSFVDVFRSKTDNIDRLDYIARKYKTMFDISPYTFLDMARDRGVYVCQSQSTNTYRFNPTAAELIAVQRAAYDNKLKTHSYYTRMGAKNGQTGFNKRVVEVAAVEEAESGKTEEVPVCRIDNPDCLSCQA